MKENHHTSTPKVSVLIPVYRTPEAYLRQAIESVLGQTLRQFELLILNDSPEDTSLEKIVASYQDPRIRYVCDGKNMGISEARNRLVELATAPYLAIMDHDDIMLPNRLQLQAEYLDAHPEVGVVGCQALHMPKGKITHYPVENDDICMALMYGCVVPHTGSMIRKSVLEQAGLRYEENYSPSEDYALWIRLIKHTRFHNLPEVLVHYRIHADNTSHTRKERMKHQTITLQTLAHELYPQLHAKSLALGKHITYIRLFGVIPLLKIVRRGNRSSAYLFDCILLYSIKRKSTCEGL